MLIAIKEQTEVVFEKDITWVEFQGIHFFQELWLLFGHNFLKFLGFRKYWWLARQEKTSKLEFSHNVTHVGEEVVWKQCLFWQRADNSECKVFHTSTETYFRVIYTIVIQQLQTIFWNSGELSRVIAKLQVFFLKFIEAFPNFLVILWLKVCLSLLLDCVWASPFPKLYCWSLIKTLYDSHHCSRKF